MVFESAIYGKDGKYGRHTMKKKSIVQELLLIVIAIGLFVLSIMMMNPRLETDLTNVSALQLQNYTKQGILLNKGDYEILAEEPMWERHQAGGHIEVDYITGFYPIKVYTKTGRSYVLAIELSRKASQKYFDSDRKIDGTLLPIPDKNLAEYAAAAGAGAYPYYLSVADDDTNFGTAFGAIMCLIIACLLGYLGISRLKGGENHGSQKE